LLIIVTQHAVTQKYNTTIITNNTTEEEQNTTIKITDNTKTKAKCWSESEIDA